MDIVAEVGSPVQTGVAVTARILRFYRYPVA